MSLWSIFKFILALPRAFCLFCQILGNRLLTSSLDKLPWLGRFVAIAWSFDTTKGRESINRLLAEKVYRLLKNDNCLEIFLQEEIDDVLRTFELTGLNVAKVKVVRYKGREYINAQHVLEDAFELAGCDPSNKKVVIVSHHHMFVRLRGMLQNLGATVCGHLTVLKYDKQADQLWVRSRWIFAGYEALAYLLFVLKGHI